MATAPKNYLIILALFIALAVTLLIVTTPAQQPELKENLPTHVAVLKVPVLDIAPRVEVAGRLQSARKTVLHFELAGQVAERLVEPGQRVEEGALLLRLGDADFKDVLQEVEAQLLQERSAQKRDRELVDLMGRQRELQARAVERLDRLGQDSLSSKAQRDEAQAGMLQIQAEQARLGYSVATATASLQQRELLVGRARRNLERARLTSPYAGVVNQIFVQAGDYVTPASPVLELLDIDNLDLYVEVTRNVATALTLGDKVSIRVGDETRQAEVVALQTDPNPATLTHALRLRVPGAGWAPGEFAVAELPLIVLEDVLAVPVSAVLREEDKAYVFSVKKGVLQRNEVVLGDRIDDRQVIKSGIDVGATIVAHSIAPLADGQQVITEKPRTTQKKPAKKPVAAPDKKPAA